MSHLILQIEKNISSRNMSDRIMWFSMWILLTISTFGIVGPLMIYYLIRRRNDHFRRQAELQKLVLDQLKGDSREEHPEPYGLLNHLENKNARTLRNACIWAISSLLIFPTIYVLYFLTKDLQMHEENQRSFFKEAASLIPSFGMSLPPNNFEVTKRPWKRYLAFMLSTFGFASVYWLYKVFNDYNDHFKKQWKTEDSLLRCLKNLKSRAS